MNLITTKNDLPNANFMRSNLATTKRRPKSDLRRQKKQLGEDFWVFRRHNSRASFIPDIATHTAFQNKLHEIESGDNKKTSEVGFEAKENNNWERISGFSDVITHE
ncbi:hypothetical protein CEXT_697141 [Caerostris extrusa]|uniref:Ycf1 n=1 Tax=Caerostris extrusa TaxID=172846 RepID=A0AAV4TN86_CAEEX|nr:hypothetical protein CEXT_697141 [Caerostris extrusa]